MADRCWGAADRETVAAEIEHSRGLIQEDRHDEAAAAVLDALTAAGWHPPLRHGDPHMVSAVMGYELGLGDAGKATDYGTRIGAALAVVDGGELDTPVPLADLRRASTGALLERHIGEPLRAISGEVMAEVAERVTAVLADLTDTEQRCRTQHYSECLCGAVAARIRRTLTGEDA